MKAKLIIGSNSIGNDLDVPSRTLEAIRESDLLILSLPEREAKFIGHQADRFDAGVETTGVEDRDRCDRVGNDLFNKGRLSWCVGVHEILL